MIPSPRRSRSLSRCAGDRPGNNRCGGIIHSLQDYYESITDIRHTKYEIQKNEKQTQFNNQKTRDEKNAKQTQSQPPTYAIRYTQYETIYTKRTQF